MNPYDIKKEDLGTKNAADDVNLDEDEFDIEELVCIIDNGSALTKVGMSCDDQPASVCTYKKVLLLLLCSSEPR